MVSIMYYMVYKVHEGVRIGLGFTAQWTEIVLSFPHNIDFSRFEPVFKYKNLFKYLFAVVFLTSTISLYQADLFDIVST